MIKLERKDDIQYFTDKEAFGEWLIENGFVKSVKDFINEEFSPWEIIAGEYTLGMIYTHYWEAEVLQTVYDWIDLGYAEEF